MRIVTPLGLAAVLLPGAPLSAAELSLSAPSEYQVVQRASTKQGKLRVAGTLSGAPAAGVALEARLLVGGKTDATWRVLQAARAGNAFEALLEGQAGGWHRLEVRALAQGKAIAQAAVAHVGIGEVFVVAGQSNAANFGEERQTPKTGRVAAFDGKRWRLAQDPQPGAGGKGGSFLPPFGDVIVQRFDVPVGFIACGIGATSVREWLPKGTTFPSPPTIETRVEKLPDGGWAARGDAFAMLVARMKSAGPRGFRAVLWHQGESDANQKDRTRTLPGKLYRAYLEKVIRGSRRAIGWDAPWFVAQVSYHAQGDESCPDIRAAQASLWKDGVALEGPDSDALSGDWRERGGRGVHFSGKGLREHGARWAAKVIPWLEQQLRDAP
jgi:hypothetical protein